LLLNKVGQLQRSELERALKQTQQSTNYWFGTGTQFVGSSGTVLDELATNDGSGTTNIFNTVTVTYNTSNFTYNTSNITYNNTTIIYNTDVVTTNNSNVTFNGGPSYTFVVNINATFNNTVTFSSTSQVYFKGEVEFNLIPVSWNASQEDDFDVTARNGVSITTTAGDVALSGFIPFDVTSNQLIFVHNRGPGRIQLLNLQASAANHQIQIPWGANDWWLGSKTGMYFLYDTVDLKWYPLIPAPQVTIQKAGVVVSTRKAINVINSASVTWAVTDNDGGDVVDLTATATGGSATPGGVNKQIQFNNSGAFGGADITWDTASLAFSVAPTAGGTFVFGAPSFICPGTIYNDFGSLQPALEIINIGVGGSATQFRISEGGVTHFAISAKGDITMGVGGNCALGTATGTKWGTATNQKQAWYNATPVVQQTQGATLTNNVTAGGTTNQLDDITSLVVYATDAAAIRNDIYQLGKLLKTVVDALRAYGLLS
jgi:hypothetical protein